MYKKSFIAATAATVLVTGAVADQKLDDVVVTAKSNKSIKDLGGAVSIITAEDIKKMNANTIKDVLIRTAGVIESGNSSSRFGRKSISIRGSQSKHVLILINGKRVNPTDNYIGHSDFQYSWIPIDLIDRIEVIKGPKSVLYGSQAIGGVVNIITKKPEKSLYGEIDVKLGISAGSGGDAQTISGNVGGQITDKLSIIVSANKNLQDAASAPRTSWSWANYSYVTDPNATAIEGKNGKNAFVKLDYDIDDTQNISATYVLSEEIREKTTNPEYYTLDRNMYNLSYHKSFDGIALDFTYGVAESDSRIYELPIFNYTHSLKDTTLRGEASISMIDNNYIVIGAETSKEEYKRSYATSTKYDYDLTTNAYFVQDEIELGDLILTLGARVDDHENFGNETTLATSATYKLDDSQRLKFSFGEGFMSPSVLQGSSAYLNASYGIQGNDDLKPESSKSYEIGYEYYGDNILFKSATYYTEVKDIIVVAPSLSGLTTNQYNNVDEATIKGLELELEYDINQNHTIEANYNYIKTEDKTTNNEFAFKPKNTINLSLSSNFNNGWSTYISARYKGSQYDTSAVKHSGYTLFDFQISKQVTDNLTLRAGIDNFTDKTFDGGNPYELERRLGYIGLNYKF